MGEIRGVLHFFSEQGMEGGVWALQDERYIRKIPARWGVWGGQTVWDASNPERQGAAKKDAELLRDGQWVPLPDPIYKDPDYMLSSLFCGEERGDRTADKRLAEKFGFIFKYAADRMNERHGEGNWRLENPGTAVTSDGTRWFFGGTPETEPRRPYGVGPNDLTRVSVEWQDGVVELRRSDTLLVLSWDYAGLHCLEDGDHLTIFAEEDPSKVVWEGTLSLEPTNMLYSPRTYQRGVDKAQWEEWFICERNMGLLKPSK